MAYLILCHSTERGHFIWWRADRRGYTANVAHAGRYSEEEARSIARIRGTDYPVSEEEVAALTTRTVVTTDDAGNLDALRRFRQYVPDRIEGGEVP